MVRQSVITFALLHEFVYELRGNNTYIILDRTALNLALAKLLKSLVYQVSWSLFSESLVQVVLNLRQYGVYIAFIFYTYFTFLCNDLQF